MLLRALLPLLLVRAAPVPAPRVIIQTGATHTGSTLLANIVQGLVDAARPVKHLAPHATVVPGTVQLSIGGQQPGQPIAAPSNLLSTSFAIHGAPVALDACGHG